jgi:hypothetical protein
MTRCSVAAVNGHASMGAAPATPCSRPHNLKQMQNREMKMVFTTRFGGAFAVGSLGAVIGCFGLFGASCYWAQRRARDPQGDVRLLCAATYGTGNCLQVTDVVTQCY